MSSADVLDRLYEVVESRSKERPLGSYVVELLDRGPDAVAAKLREECEEVIEARAEGDGDHLAHEVADLVFHLWVLMAAAELPPARVYAKLEQRFGVGGLVEKAARSRDDGVA